MKKYIATLLLLLGVAFSTFAQQEVTITGVVSDDTGEPLPGANISVKNATGLGTITDIDGKYSIKVQQYQTLVFSFMGFQSQEVMVKDQKSIDVTLSENKVSAMDELVVTGMQAQKKLTLTGAVTNVKMDDLKHFSTSSLTNTLAGNVAGIMAFQSSGQPGKNTSEFWIRGISTFGAGTKAYILVDGFERENLDDINIEDI